MKPLAQNGRPLVDFVLEFRELAKNSSLCGFELKVWFLAGLDNWWYSRMPKTWLSPARRWLQVRAYSSASPSKALCCACASRAPSSASFSAAPSRAHSSTAELLGGGPAMAAQAHCSTLASRVPWPAMASRAPGTAMGLRTTWSAMGSALETYRPGEACPQGPSECPPPSLLDVILVREAPSGRGRYCQGVSVTSHQLWTPCPRILPGSHLFSFTITITLSSDSLHLSSAIKSPLISTLFPVTHRPVYCSLPRTWSVWYLPVFTYLQIPNPTLFSSAPGSRTPHEPAQKPNISIQLRIIELDFLLDSHLPSSKRSPLAPHVNKLACISLTCCLQLDLWQVY